MITWKRGDIDCRPMACIEYGLALGVIECIKKPDNAYLDQGKVRYR